VVQQLYASALTGQGLSLEVSYVKVLVAEGENYAKELAGFKKAVKAKNTDLVSPPPVPLCVHGHLQPSQIPLLAKGDRHCLMDS
jgi:hypothetical protein